MSSRLSRLIMGLSSLVLASACSAAPEGVDAADSELGVSEQALSSDASFTKLGSASALDVTPYLSAADPGSFGQVTAGALSVARHTCEGNYCDCTGDPECNEMFSGNDCATGPRTAVCHIRNDVPKCRCTRAAKAE